MCEVNYVEKYHDIIYRVNQEGVMLDLVFFTIMIYFLCSYHEQCAAVILNRTRESNDNYNTHVRSKICPGIYHDIVYIVNKKGRRTRPGFFSQS